MAEEAAEAERLKKEQELMMSGHHHSITEIHTEKMESLDNMYDEDIINEIGEDCKEVRAERWGRGACVC